MGLFGILLGLALLVWLAYRGWSILLLAPGAALIAAAFAGGPLLAYWTQTFMDNASRFIAQFFPLFLLGALFGKLMEDSGSVAAIASFMTEKLGPQRAILTVVLAGALVTYGGVSLFVAFFVLVPMAQAVFRTARDSQSVDSRRGRFGHLDFHDVGITRNAGHPECDPDAVLWHHAIGSARSRDHCFRDHARFRLMVAGACRCGRPPQGRRIWLSLHHSGRRGGQRRNRAPACHYFARVRSPRGRSRPPGPRGAADLPWRRFRFSWW